MHLKKQHIVYFATIILLMFVMPVGSIVVEAITRGTGLTWLLVCGNSVIHGGVTANDLVSLAGINHLLQPHRNQKENMAMVTDLVAAVVLLAAFIAAIHV